MEELQTDEATRARWIFYSALDAKATWELYHSLQVNYCLPHAVLANVGTKQQLVMLRSTQQGGLVIIALMRKPT